MKTESQIRYKDNISKLIILTTIVILLWGFSGYLTYKLIPGWSDRGTFGDMFGAINGLFSGLAFAALIYTIILQRQEIQMNRDEIKMNRKELKKSAIAQEEQVKQTHLAAKINAFSTVINYYNIQVGNSNNSSELIEKARFKRKALIHQLDELIEGLSDSDVE